MENRASTCLFVRLPRIKNWSYVKQTLAKTNGGIEQYVKSSITLIGLLLFYILYFSLILDIINDQSEGVSFDERISVLMVQQSHSFIVGIWSRYQEVIFYDFAFSPMYFFQTDGSICCCSIRDWNALFHVINLNWSAELTYFPDLIWTYFYCIYIQWDW
jgi:hypothetical protein